MVGNCSLYFPFRVLGRLLRQTLNGVYPQPTVPYSAQALEQLETHNCVVHLKLMTAESKGTQHPPAILQHPGMFLSHTLTLHLKLHHCLHSSPHTDDLDSASKKKWIQCRGHQHHVPTPLCPLLDPRIWSSLGELTQSQGFKQHLFSDDPKFASSALTSLQRTTPTHSLTSSTWPALTCLHTLSVLLLS